MMPPPKVKYVEPVGFSEETRPYLLAVALRDIEDLKEQNYQLLGARDRYFILATASCGINLLFVWAYFSGYM